MSSNFFDVDHFVVELLDVEPFIRPTKFKPSMHRRKRFVGASINDNRPFVSISPSLVPQYLASSARERRRAVLGLGYYGLTAAYTGKKGL